MKKEIFVITAILVLTTLNLIAQVSTSGNVLNNILSSNSKARTSQSARVNSNLIVLTEINNESEQKRANEITKQCATCKKDFYGTGIDTKINIKNGTLEHLKEGQLWITTVESTGAFALQFYFDLFKVPPGSELYFRNAEGTMTLGSFGNHNNHVDEKFATQTIAGDRVDIYYYEPANATFSGELIIGKVIHAFKNVYRSGGFGSSQSCNKDVNCPEGSNYQDVKRGVARISFYDSYYNLTAHCTGSLLNTTSNSKKPYLLTAYHCVTAPLGWVGSSYNYWQWIFEFNYEKQFCNGSVEPIANSVQGATLLSKGEVSDYALLNIGNVPDSYNVLYLGWDTREVVPAKTVAIHHPHGDVKKISTDNQAPVLAKTSTVGSNFDEIEGMPKTDLKVTWDSGITEGGSSGSPLIDQNKRVVGQLRGGLSNCGNSESDYFGRLAHSMTNPDIEFGFSPLKSFLDDNNFGATNWSSLDPNQPNNETFRVNSITLTSSRWEDSPKLGAMITYSGNLQDLTYSWSPAEDFYDPHASVGILSFGGQKPILPLTKQYTVTVTTPGNLIGNAIITVTLYDCQNKNIDLDLCSETSTGIGFAGGPGETYLWTPSANLSSSDISNPMFSPPTAGSYQYTLVATSAYCTRTENYNISATGFPTLPSFNPAKIGEKAISSGGATGIKTSDGYILLLNGLKLTKLDPSLNVIWSTNLGGNYARGIVEVSDGYVVLVDFLTGASSHHGVSLAKVNFNGTITWQKFYFPETTQQSHSPIDIFALKDGDILVTGKYSNSFQQPFDCGFLYRFDPNGIADYLKIITHVVNGNYINYYMNASTMVGDNEVYFMGDQYFYKVWSSNGTISYVKSHSLGYVNKFVWGHDGKFIGVNAQAGSYGFSDVRVTKFDLNANLLWSKYFGGSQSESSPAIISTTDGGYLIPSNSPSPANGTKSQPAWNNSSDFWLFKIDNNGNELGDVRYGGTGIESGNSLIDLGLGNYLVACSSSSGISGDRTVANVGGSDTWIIKISDTGSPSTNPNPQQLNICDSSDSNFNNLTDPYRNELVIIGGCPAEVTFELDSKTSVRASEQIIIKPGVHIKYGAQFYAKNGSVNLSPCDVAIIPNGSSEDSGMQTLDAKVIETNLMFKNFITAFPNPTTGWTTVKIELTEQSDLELMITSSLGVKVYSKKYHDKSIIIEELDFASLGDGIYHIQAIFLNQVMSQKLILSK